MRQRCSISPLLFVLVVEALAVSLRDNSKVSGIPIPGCRDVVKISQYADDLNVFVPDTRSIYECLKMVAAFGKASGLCLNLEKSWGFWLGGFKGRTDAPFGLKWTNLFPSSLALFSRSFPPVIRAIDLEYGINRTLILRPLLCCCIDVDFSMLNALQTDSHAGVVLTQNNCITRVPVSCASVCWPVAR